MREIFKRMDDANLEDLIAIPSRIVHPVRNHRKVPAKLRYFNLSRACSAVFCLLTVCTASCLVFTMARIIQKHTGLHLVEKSAGCSSKALCSVLAACDRWLLLSSRGTCGT